MATKTQTIAARNRVDNLVDAELDKLIILTQDKQDQLDTSRLKYLLELAETLDRWQLRVKP